VAIPEDTPALRAKAEKLMQDQFPGGYVIDDVHVVAVGRPHNQHTEVMLYYHAGVPVAQGVPPVSAAAPSGLVVMPHVQPASLTTQPVAAQPAAAQPGGLPPEPVPVDAR
jgi:hypothetical protein